MINPELKQKWGIFRQQKRAWRSLVVFLVLFGVCLPAEWLCNSKPLVIRYRGHWYFPVLKRYPETAFGGVREMEPDYLSPLFLQRLQQKARTTGLPSLPAPAFNPPALTGKFDDEPNPGLNPKPLSRDELLSRFDPEPGELTDASPPVSANPAKSGRAWILWPPIRYDYARIATHSRSGRDVLAAPFSRRDSGPGEVITSSWIDGHYLGTDDRGRDVLARLIYGYRVSLIFGLSLALTAAVIGTALGGIQGFFGGGVDLIGQRLSEIWGSLPRLYLLMILSSLLARNIWILFLILNLTSWMGIAAYMRAEFLRVRNFDFVRAARALGVSDLVIMVRHLLPNALTPVITFFPFMVTGGVLALVSLDFLGLGVPSPYPSLGELLAQGQANLQAVWIIVPTFLLLSVTIILLTFIGEGVRNAFDPRHYHYAAGH